MDINNLSKTELLKLKSEIDIQIKDIDEKLSVDIETSCNKKILKNLNSKDLIFGVNFSAKHNIHNMGYVHMTFTKNVESDYTSFSTMNKDSCGLGCSSGIKNDVMEHHCFLSEFSSSIFYFFTLKPETWEKDVIIELDKMVKQRKERFNIEMRKMKIGVRTILKKENKKIINDNFKAIKISKDKRKYNI